MSGRKTSSFIRNAKEIGLGVLAGLASIFGIGEKPRPQSKRRKVVVYERVKDGRIHLHIVFLD